MVNYTTKINEYGRTQVLVVGSGSAGATAALTAASLGAKVTLIERYGFMGGISTQVLDTFYGFFIPGNSSRKVVGGIPDLVIEELVNRKAAIFRPNTYGAGQGITYDPELLKVIWEELALAMEIQILFHSLVIDVIVENERLTGVIFANKAGLHQIKADVIIDASGDADLAALAGVPYESAQDQPVQSLTTTFKMINVDVHKAKTVTKNQLQVLMESTAGYDLPRKEGSAHISPLANVMVTNMTRVINIDPNNIEALSAAEIEGRRQAFEYARFLVDQVPGYEKASLGGLSTQIGVRESRRIIGQYRLSRSDVLKAAKFSDAIALCGAPIEEHHAGMGTRWEYLPEGETYQIPLRCLLPQSLEGLLVAGRCLSADHDAHASVRSMGQCMAMGQAAGVTAALTIQKKKSIHELSIFEIQSNLRTLGAILE
ncbi:MAG: FAD-dependent oxidoreductase [Anaerolineaceae bacterium]